MPCWNERVAKLNTLYLKNSTSIIWSDEAYSFARNTKVHTQHVYETFRTIFEDDWNLLFVVAYRRYAEWLLSSLKQRHLKVHCVGEKSAWDNMDKPDMPKSSNCETPYDYILKSFSEFEEIKKNKKVQVHNYKCKTFSSIAYTNIDETTSVLQSANIPVKILNFHDEQHILSSFYCDIILPNAPHTCHHNRC